MNFVRWPVVLLVLALVIWCPSSPAFAAPGPATEQVPSVSSSQIVERAAEMDGGEISFRGEVIGEIMPRGANSWVNVSDGPYAIGVWAPRSQADAIRFAGRYGVKGDVVVLRGVFNRACAEHGGDFDIHAASVEVVESGGTRRIPVEYHKLAFAAVCLLAGFSLMGAHRYRRASQPSRFTWHG